MVVAGITSWDDPWGRKIWWIALHDWTKSKITYHEEPFDRREDAEVYATRQGWSIKPEYDGRRESGRGRTGWRPNPSPRYFIGKHEVTKKEWMLALFGS